VAAHHAALEHVRAFAGWLREEVLKMAVEGEN
jgi:hypothetical protein